MRRRIAEDIDAHALAGRVPTNLGFVDRMYRRCAPAPAHVDIDSTVVAVLPAVSKVYAPVGVSHRDHRLVRSYATAVARNGIPVCLYADLPYATRFGWPPWVTGSASDPHLDVDAEWDANPMIPKGRRPRIVTLGGEEAAAKLAAIRRYRSQLPALDAGPLHAISNPIIHGFEVFWDLT
jgi:LmbE family N-acetylglucosaminyl deacetylase